MLIWKKRFEHPISPIEVIFWNWPKEDEPVIANSLLKCLNPKHRASFREIWTPRGTPFSPEQYMQLDHMLVKKGWLPSVHTVRTYPHLEWDTNRYLMVVHVQVR